MMKFMKSLGLSYTEKGLWDFSDAGVLMQIKWAWPQATSSYSNT